MLQTPIKIALGGGCHWCTEAVFQSLSGVLKVSQGFVSSTGIHNTFSEAVIVYFDADKISLQTLIEIHLQTHKSTSNHAMRIKYRSAVYAFSNHQKLASEYILERFQNKFENKLITQVYAFHAFKASREQIKNYYYSNPKKPFCKTFINPKLKILLQQFSYYTNQNKLEHLNTGIETEVID